MNKAHILMLFILLHLASIFAILPERILSSTSEGHWVAITILFVTELMVLWLYMKSLQPFPGKSAIDICLASLGNWGTRLVVLPIIVFMFIEVLLLMYFQEVEIKAVLLQKTPAPATLLLFISLCFYAAWKGLTVIIRASIALSILLMPFIVFSILISIQNFRISYIFPIWDSHWSFFAQPDFYLCTVIFSGFLFLGMLPSKQRISFGQISLAMGIIFVLAMGSVYVPLMVFGHETAVNLQYPMLMSSDTVDLEWVIFDWLPSFYVVASSALGLLKVSVLLWILVTLAHRLFLPGIGAVWILAVICAALYLISMIIPNVDALNHYFHLNTIVCVYSVIGFPIIVFLASLRQRKRVI
ncbi:spore germination protein [Paenibacillus endoradicis]|uniref:spore germination protein n=1 Tax=Paenibacillus endoradicis TaxID=2972487 RepID=UPI002158D3BE|nr:spore germination protein [Paenibacillus endoradicis]MCR8656586.1 spore germination protein [Paenibacillus endoradicis]